MALLLVLVSFAVGLGWVRHASVEPIMDNETSDLKATEREMWDTINSANGVASSLAPVVSRTERLGTKAARPALAEAPEQGSQRPFPSSQVSTTPNNR